MKEKEDLELKKLGQFYGTEQYHSVLGSDVTDGIMYLMHNGYSWFITDTLVTLKMKDKVKNEDFVSIKLNVIGDKASVVMEDGNGNKLYSQKYEYTNVKRELKLFYTNNVLMLAGEY